MTFSDAPPHAPSSAETPIRWIESRAGGVFFAQALLVAPAATVLIPLTLAILLRAAGWLAGPSRLFDTIPLMAWYFLPRVGWLAGIAAFTTWRALGVVRRTGPRRALAIFLAVHLITLALCLGRWVAALV